MTKVMITDLCLILHVLSSLSLLDKHELAFDNRFSLYVSSMSGFFTLCVSTVVKSDPRSTFSAIYLGLIQS